MHLDRGDKLIIMTMVVGYTIALLGAVAAYLLGRGKSNKEKMIVWGILLMIPISEALAFSLGVTTTYIMNDAWIQIVVWGVTFPIFFIIGLVMFLFGKFNKVKD